MLSNVDRYGDHIIKREEPFNRLVERFKTSGTTIINQQSSAGSHQVVTGLGGIGKTQLAKYYAYQCRNEYQLVWWCRAESKAVLFEDMQKLVEEISNADGLKDYAFDWHGLSEKEFLVKVKRLFNLINNVLLILDNVETEDVVLDFIPLERPNNSHVLMTSRRQNFETFHDAVCPLQVFTETEAVSLLQRYVAWDKNKQACRELTVEEAQAAKDLARELGYLPLALRQAGAYLERKKVVTLKSYLDEFRKNHALLTEDERTKLGDYPFVVKATWEMNLSVIYEGVVGRQQELVGNFLGYLSYLSADSISIEFLQRVLQVSEIELGDLLEPFGNYSLLEVHAERPVMSLHRLVQKVIQLKHDDEQMNKYLSGLLDFFYQEYLNFSESINELKDYLPHLENISSLFESPQWRALMSPKKKQMELQCYFLLLEIHIFLGAFDQASSYCKKVLEIKEKPFLDIDQLFEARLFLVIANAKGFLGDFQAKFGFLNQARRVIEVAQKYLSVPTKEMLSIIFEELSSVCSDLQDMFPEMIVYATKALELRLQVCNGDSEASEMASPYVVLGNAYFSNLNYDEAEECFNKSLKTKGFLSYVVETVTFFMFRQQYTETVNLLKKAIGLPGDHHQYYAKNCIPFMDKYLAREITDDQPTLSLKSNLLCGYFSVRCYCELGQLDDVFCALSQLQKLIAAQPFPQSYNFLVSYLYEDIALLYFKRGKAEEAANYFRLSLEADSNSNREIHGSAYLVDDLSNLMRCYFDGRVDELDVKCLRWKEILNFRFSQDARNKEIRENRFAAEKHSDFRHQALRG